MISVKEGVYGFTGEYRWLSNFWSCTIVSKTGLVFDSTEAAYQAAKCANPDDMKRFEHLSAKDSKFLGRRIAIRPDWEFVKDRVMLAVLRQKFRPGTPLADKLLATGDLYLEETNTWGDKYWGVSGGVGKNRLGELLMQVRTELKGIT